MTDRNGRKWRVQDEDNQAVSRLQDKEVLGRVQDSRAGLGRGHPVQFWSKATREKRKAMEVEEVSQEEQGHYLVVRLDQIVIPSFSNLECLLFSFTSINIYGLLLYRPASLSLPSFLSSLEEKIKAVDIFNGRKIILGDFNDDIFKSDKLVRFMERHNYRQCVKSSTTEKDTLIDHIYVKDIKNEIINIIPCYFSFHEIINISIV